MEVASVSTAIAMLDEIDRVTIDMKHYIGCAVAYCGVRMGVT